MLTELSKTIRFDNASKGFDPTEGGVNRYILLTISELCEAQEEYRDGRGITEVYYKTKVEVSVIPPSIEQSKGKPEGVPVEIADAIIRLLDIHGKFDRQIESLPPPVDFGFDGEATFDDWMLGIVDIIADASNYRPTEEDFWDALGQGLETLFLYCEQQKIPIFEIIQEKLAYNRTRPPKHGRKF